ncbi:steroid 5-alpha reductase family enzyme [Paenibacillus anaericanus]|uniref:hypothetical protein n=1 Tax=Paenibacillus anaericanus TaxID=170367 RepID=UPI00277D62EB|nr:hypothetical protein [Paenibacillus anaericanus]MDQ0091997.1 steroid 5-alpha reductase family enzyme [Paenibacillus anaericanus]
MEQNKIGMSVIGALLAAIVGGAVWALIAITTEYELGIIAWAIGGLAGYAVSYFAGKRTSVTIQLIAVIASVLGILLGKYFIVAYFYNYESFNGMFSSEVFSFFKETFVELFEIMDLVFVAFAVVTAWQLPNKLANKAEAPQQPLSPQ